MRPPAAELPPIDDARLAEAAAGIEVTPEEVAEFKRLNPMFAEMDDARASQALKEITAAALIGKQDDELRTAERNAPKTIDDVDPYMFNPSPVAAGIIKSGLETYDFVNEVVLRNNYEPGEWRQGFENYYSNLSGFSGVSATVAQWVTSFVGLGKFAKLAKIAPAAPQGTAAYNLARGAGADLLAFDGHAARISDMVQSNSAFGTDLANPITAYLASNPDDSELEGRLKNALEGAGLGLTVDAALKMFGALRYVRAGNAEAGEQATDEAIKTFDELNAEVPKAEVRADAAQTDTIAADAAKTQPAADAKTASDSGATAAAASESVAQQPAAPAQIKASLDQFRLQALAKEIAGDIANDPLKRTLFTEYPEQAPTPSTFDSLTDSSELRSIVKATEDEILKGIDGALTQKNGRVSVEESQRLAGEFAAMTGTDQGVFLARMSQDADSIQQLHARLLAYDQTTRSMAAGLRDMAQAVRRKEPGEFGSLEELHSAFETRLANYAQIQDWLKGVRSETGRALNILKYSRQIGPTLQSADGTPLSALRPAKSIEDLAEDVLLAGTDRATLAKVANPSAYERVRDGLVALFIKNILSGFTTHITNITGNTLASLTHPASKIVGGMVRADAELMAQGAKQYSYMMTEAFGALKMAGEAYKRGHAILDGQARKLSGAPIEALDAANLGLDPGSITGKLFDAGATLLDGVSTRALEASDEFFKQLMYSSEIMSRAFTDGVNLGLKGAELRAYVTTQRNAAFKEVDELGPRVANVEGNAQAEASLRAARIGTFTQDVKPKGVASYVLAGTSRWPGLKFAVPFVRVVNNIMSYASAMTPGLQGLSRIYKEAIERGGQEAATAQGRLALGSALWTAAVGLAAGGYITGAGPLDKKGKLDYQKKQALEQTGWRAHSLKIGDTYIPLDRLDPIGFPFNMAGEFYERWQQGQRDEFAAEQVAGAVALALYHNLADRSFLKGFTDLFNAISDKDGSQLGQFATNVVGSLLVPNIIRQTVTTQVDPYLHEARGFLENIMRRVPGLSDNLAVRRMPWGEKMTLNPALYNVDKPDPVMREYARLLETGEQGIPEPLPRMKDRPGDKPLDLAREALPDGRNLYDVYGDLVAQPTPDTPPLKDELRKLMESDDYKHKLIDGPGTLNGTRLKAIRTIIGRYRQAAWRVMLRDHPTVAEKFFEAKMTTAAKSLAAQHAIQSEWLH